MATTSGVQCRRREKRKRVLPFEKPSEKPSETCPICSVTLECADVICHPACDHQFHRQCLLNWIQCSNGTCPVCRQGEQSFEPLQPLALGHEYMVTIRTNGEAGEGDSSDTKLVINSSLDNDYAASIFKESVRSSLLALPSDNELRVGLHDACWFSQLFANHPHIRVCRVDYDDEYNKVSVTTLTSRQTGQLDSFTEKLLTPGRLSS